MATENDTPAAPAAPERYASFHTSADDAHSRPVLRGGDVTRVILIDQQAEPRDLACLIDARANQLKKTLDVLACSLHEDDAVAPAEIVGILVPLVDEIAKLGDVLARRLAGVQHG
jgi:hypothetical protein